MTRFNKTLAILFLVGIVSLFLYSYTQVDLNLTLSRISIWQVIEKAFQYIGYFNRPLSALLYVGIIISLFILYGLFLRTASKKQLNVSCIWKLFTFNAVLLTFSYNAFSYDLFNYIFYGRIITFYHKNPYLYRALDFPHDKMLNFMHWTHNTYPYGPLWLVIATPLSYIGFQVFLITLYLYKAIASASYLGIIYFIGKINSKKNEKVGLISMIAFGLNPLVIIEGLVSSHNDMAMLFFAIASLYFLLNQKYIRSYLLLGISIGIKFATIFLLPGFLFVFIAKKMKMHFTNNTLYTVSFLSMVIAVYIASIRSTFQPWYVLYIIPFAALLFDKSYIRIPVSVFCFFALCEYIPFLYKGDWNNPVPTILYWLTILPIIFAALYLAWFLMKKYVLTGFMIKY